jgi:hypothetical protein
MSRTAPSRIPEDKIREGQNPLPSSPKRLTSWSFKESMNMKRKKATITPLVMISSFFIETSRLLDYFT